MSRPPVASNVRRPRRLGIEPVRRRLEVDVGIHDNPVGLAAGPGDVSIQARRAAVTDLPHVWPPPVATEASWPLPAYSIRRAVLVRRCLVGELLVPELVIAR